ncbi:hypothetical protein HKCCE3408_01860 [Rhodobacterales bacterium HKCCE3408]|nr:hypothetical protein [Rhodobacterales bacterium HKCCE3408]
MRIAILAAALSALPVMAAAATNCSSGAHVADARLVSSANIGPVGRATQFAWDGGNRIVHVCNLDPNAYDFQGTWSVYAGEIDAEFPDICIALEGIGGVAHYSCAGPERVAQAFAAPLGSGPSTLIFSQWGRGLSDNAR